MSRTELDAATLAKALRRMAGDGSVEWVTGPIQASVLLDVADLMDENTKLRELLDYMTPIAWYAASERERDDMRELGVEVKQ